MTNENANTQPFPKRGLAMVLIAVAVLLGLWGIYALTQGDSDSTTTASETSTTSAPTTAAPASSAPAEQPAASPQEAQPAEATPAPAAPAPAPATGVVHVLNNSTESGLAADTANALRGRGEAVGIDGNLAGDLLTVPQNTVFFHPGHEQAARELADRVGAVAAPYNPAIGEARDETRHPQDLTLVLVGPIAAVN